MTSELFPIPDDIIGGLATTSVPIFEALAPWVLIIGGIFLGLGVIGYLIRSLRGSY